MAHRRPPIPAIRILIEELAHRLRERPAQPVDRPWIPQLALHLRRLEFDGLAIDVALADEPESQHRRGESEDPSEQEDLVQPG